MADVANKYPENVPGKFYIDDQCIDCDLCRETAPANFKRNDDGGHSYVYKQAESPEEEALCKEAMEGCPVEAIGSDGTSRNLTLGSTGCQPVVRGGSPRSATIDSDLRLAENTFLAATEFYRPAAWAPRMHRKRLTTGERMTIVFKL
jgi:ferredoxin